MFGVLFAAFGVGALARRAGGGCDVARRPGALSSSARPGSARRCSCSRRCGTTRSPRALLLVVGFCFSTWTANSQSILQLTAPDRLRGRVLGLYLFVFAGFSPIGGLLAGWLADVGGTELAFAVAGTSGLVATAVAVARLRDLREARRSGPVVAIAEEEPEL